MTDPGVSLAGQTALVTGAARRLGRATALALATAGADVIVHYNRSMGDAAAVAERIDAMGRKAWTIQADLAEPAEVETLMDQALDAAGAIDVLINNASIFPTGRVTDVAAADIVANVQIHAIAPLLLARRFAAQGCDGHIVNFLDARIGDYDREHAAYHLSKRMLLELTRMLALELAPTIAVNAVAPGLILPPTGEDDSYLQRLASTNPLNRHGDAEDITRAVLFLLDSRFMTGQVLYVDGGRHIKGNVYHL